MQRTKSSPTQTTQTAVELGQSEVAQSPHSAAAHNNLAWGHYGATAYEEALKEFDLALTFDNAYLDAHYGKGLTLRALHRNQDAKDAFHRVAELVGTLDDHVRGVMIRRLALGQIREMETGDWGLEQEIWHRKS